MDDKILKLIEDSRFCYSRVGGQGYVPKNECTCSREFPCQALIDMYRFHHELKELDEGDNSRQELIKKIKPNFKNSQWWRDNVIE